MALETFAAGEASASYSATMSITDCLREQVGKGPNRLFAQCGDERLDYATADSRARDLAAGLAGAGIEPGDRIAVLCTNRIEQFELFLASALRGSVEVPLNAYLKGEFLRYQLHDCGAKMLIADAAGVAAAAPLLSELPALETVVLLDPESTDTSTLDSRIERIDFAVLRAGSGSDPDGGASGTDLASIVYTSGTTGLPKGCMMSQAYYMNAGLTICRLFDPRDDDVMYAPLPLFHAAARTFMAAAVRGGVSVVVEDFNPQTVWARMSATGATLLVAVGAIGVAMVAGPDPAAPVALRHAMFIPLAADLQERFEQRFGVPVYTELYGQTEFVPATLTPLHGPFSHSRASLGREAEHAQVRVVDDTGTVVAVGETGELCLRPNYPEVMFQGYWNKPEATVEALRGVWYHTGDFARQDADGFFYFVDRKKDMMRRKGENVSSFELERAIVSHAAIVEAAAHAVPHADIEDDIKVCLVLDRGAGLTPQEAFDFFGANLPYFAIPRYVEVLVELPKNAVGRVMKHELRERGVTDQTWDLQALGLVLAREHRR